MIYADVLDWARDYDGEKFHALLTDPPYEMSFMGKDWDRSGIAFKPDTWAALAEHLYPGAFGMAFASARGWHRLAVAIEDAGLRIHPSIFGWSYGSGFPKATRIDTQVDKAAGAEREEIAQRIRLGDKKSYPGDDFGKHGIYGRGNGGQDITAPATDLAQSWAGHRYGLQALKPALEPIIVFQKPYIGKPLDCNTETGAGALWIDGGRVKSVNENPRGSGCCGSGSTWDRQDKGMFDAGRVWGGNVTPSQGRWPANLTLQHHPDCVRVGEKRVKGIGGGEKSSRSIGGSGIYQGGGAIQVHHYTNETVAAWECVESCPVRRLGEQSGERGVSGSAKNGRPATGSDYDKTKMVYGQGFGKTQGPLYNDKGTAARFFHQSDWSYEIAERLAQADLVRYQAKASRKERTCNGTVDTRHPTVKPIALTRWLATLLLPPPEYAPRRILIPFAGVASEMIGAHLAGWDEIVGVELDAEYCDIGLARFAHWKTQAQQMELAL